MFKKIAAAAVLAALAAPSFAATPGTYAGVEVGSTRLDDVGREASYGAFVGYNFNPHFAMEGALDRLGSFAAPGTDIRVDQAVVSVIGKLPVTEQFHVFGRYGRTFWHSTIHFAGNSATDNQNGALFGVGAGYDFAANLAGRVEVQQPAHRTVTTAVSLIYSF
jgi:OOP family OmpA-OmpF porin